VLLTHESSSAQDINLFSSNSSDPFVIIKDTKVGTTQWRGLLCVVTHYGRSRDAYSRERRNTLCV
jgi:hypothetical protein